MSISLHEMIARSGRARREDGMKQPQVRKYFLDTHGWSECCLPLRSPDGTEKPGAWYVPETEHAALRAQVGELQRSLDQAFSILGLYGVPRERAKTVANGVDVFAARCQKQEAEQSAEMASQRAGLQRIADECKWQCGFEKARNIALEALGSPAASPSSAPTADNGGAEHG